MHDCAVSAGDRGFASTCPTTRTGRAPTTAC
jgi:hypothetical protein